MKTVLAIFLLSFATVSLAQTTPMEQAAAPGCGKDDVKFDVKTEKSQHPFAKPGPGRPSSISFKTTQSFSPLRDPLPASAWTAPGLALPTAVPTSMSLWTLASITSVRGGNLLPALTPVRNRPPLALMRTPAEFIFSLFGIMQCRRRCQRE